jgi:DEAD/DEAH box helicase domain-containing protein
MYRWVSDTYPAAEISLRTSSSDTIVIQDHTGDEPQVIGEIDRQSAPMMVYTGAVYLHEGRQFIIDELDWQQGIARAMQAEVDYYTDASSTSDVSVEEEYTSQLAGDCVKVQGRVTVTHQATTDRLIKRDTHETLGYGQIELPALQFETTAYWIALTPDLTSQLEAENILLRPNDYGPNWSEQRDKARQRDAYRCTRCQAPERPDRQHDVHHFRPFRDFGYVPGRNRKYLEANQLENLITLCAACHQAVEAAQGRRSALSGLGSVLRNIATLLLMCAPTDIGIVVDQRSTHTKVPTITIYDHAPGGMGLASRLYDLHDELLAGALELVRDCPCLEGCPACVGPVGEVGADTKALTTQLLEAIVAV